MQDQQFFWLHIKKAAGTATRQLLSPEYSVVDWRDRPGSFIQASPGDYNDILNRFNTLLGEYQFRRALFAKTYLYPESWSELCSFAFSREPTQRCVSMFHYMFWRRQGAPGYVRNLAGKFKSVRSLHLTPSSTFDFFLDNVEAARSSPRNSQPLGLHFTTHTAPMWDDITDDDGSNLLRYVFRLESLVPAINQVFSECGVERRVRAERPSANVSKRTSVYRPSRAQVRRIETLYSKDFELYENALTVTD